MRNHYFICSLLLGMVLLASCQKEEDDFSNRVTPTSTQMCGTVCTTGDKPLAGVEVSVDYQESAWLSYSKTRHKAKGSTGRDGKYELNFEIRDDEVDSEGNESGVYRSFTVSYNLASLSRDRYILPQDMALVITSVNPPIAVLDQEASSVITEYIYPEKAAAYVQDLFIPRKRVVPVTLTGFVPRQTAGTYGNVYDTFELEVSFPYGPAADTHAYPGSPYGVGMIGNGLYALYDKAEATYQVPLALGEQNTIRLVRNKGGEHTVEEHTLYVTDAEPRELVFTY